MGPPSSGPRAALLVVRLASRLVPRASRGAWLREWEAEILARWDELAAGRRPGLRDRMDLMARAAGSALDALFYDDGRWTMEGWTQDLAGAARSLVRRPGFSSVVVLTLGLGIGASTALFSVAHDVLLRPFPYPEPDQVVALIGVPIDRADFSGNVTYPNLTDIAEGTSSFEAIALTRWWAPSLEDDRGAVIVRGATVTANYFALLGVQPGAGRLFRPEEQGTGREATVVLTHRLWMDRFGGDPSVVGGTVRVSGAPYRVIGVTAEDFEDPWLMDAPGAEPQIFRTVSSPPSEWPRSGRSWKGIARVRSDVTLDAAQEELDAIWSGLVEAYPEQNARRLMRLVPLRDRVAGPARPVLLTLLGSVGLLLLIACANLANLMLGRALDRQPEFAVHRALGAPGRRLLVRGLLEAGLLSAVGGALGLGLAALLTGSAARLGSLLPRPVTGDLDPIVLLFAVAVTTGAGLLFGLGPAVHAARSGSVGVQRTRGATLGHGAHMLRRALVVGELALTAALLIASGVLVRDFARLGAVDLGLRTEGVAALELHGSAWWELEPAAAEAQWSRVLEAVRAVPGVEGAGAIDYVPLDGNYSCDGIIPEDRPPPGPGEGRCAEVRVVLPGALDALGIPLLQGRHLRPSDAGDAPRVAVIDRRMGEAFWPGEDAVGKRFQVHGYAHEVVGVVGDMRHFGPAGAVRPMVYLHAPQEGWNGIARGLSLVVRSDDGLAPLPGVRAAVASVNGSIAVGDPQPLHRLLHGTLAEPRFRTGLMAAFGLSALVLAVLGIAGVMSYSVARRTREMGVRLAMGAEPTSVRRLVMREGAQMVLAGVGLGVGTALAAAGALDGVLELVGARDPLVYAVVAATLAGTALLACWLPAHRASRVDPVRVLTAE